MDRGDANIIDVENGVLRRSDTHPDREHRSWIVNAWIEPEKENFKTAANNEVDHFHDLLLSAGTPERKAELLRNHRVPKETNLLIDAGLRCIPLLSDPSIDDEPGKSAHARMELIMSQLRRKESTIEVIHAIDDMESAIAREQKRSQNDVIFGCVFVLSVIAVLAAIAWWVFG